MDQASFDELICFCFFFLQENVVCSFYSTHFQGVFTSAILDVTPRVCRCVNDEVGRSQVSAARLVGCKGERLLESRSVQWMSQKMTAFQPETQK